MSDRYRRLLTSRAMAVPLAIVAAIVGFGVLLAVGRSPSSDGDEAASRAPSLGVRRSRLGRILVDPSGRTLYLFREDAKGKSSCYGGCARVWPPLLVSGKPRAGRGVDPGKLTTTRRRDAAALQLVYNGHPLYRADADERPGDTAGQAFLGTWFVVSPAGRQIGKAKSTGGY